MTTALLLGRGWQEISSINFSEVGLDPVLQGMDTFSKKSVWDWWNLEVFLSSVLWLRRSLFVRCGFSLEITVSSARESWLVFADKSSALRFTGISCRWLNSCGCSIAPQTLHSPLYLYSTSYEKIHKCLLQNSHNKLLAKLERRIRFSLISVFSDSNSNKKVVLPMKLAKSEKNNSPSDLIRADIDSTSLKFDW